MVLGRSVEGVKDEINDRYLSQVYKVQASRGGVFLHELSIDERLVSHVFKDMVRQGLAIEVIVRASKFGGARARKFLTNGAFLADELYKPALRSKQGRKSSF